MAFRSITLTPRAPKVRWKIATRIKLDQLPKADELKKQLAESVSALDLSAAHQSAQRQGRRASRATVKGIVRFLSWEDTTATVVLADEFAPSPRATSLPSRMCGKIAKPRKSSIIPCRNGGRRS